MLRRLVLPVLTLLFLAATLPTPTTAVAASGSTYGNARLDQWSWLTTHNSYADEGALPPRNQSRNISQQLDDGVRGLMLDTYDVSVNPDDPYVDLMMCHSTAACFESFRGGLGRVVDFLQANEDEVVTIFLENYASRETLTQAFTDVLTAKHAQNLLFSPTKYDIDKRNWPLLRTMVADNRRLVVFQDKWADDVPVRSSSDGRLMYTWSHTVETLYDYDGRPNGCASRNGNPVGQNPMPGTSLTPLFTMNQFDSSVLNPEAKAPGDNGASLKKRIDNDCRPAAGRNPNFVAVNFYQHSDTAGVTPLSVVAELNRNAYIYPPHPALWTVNSAKQYVGQTHETYASNRCMVRGEEFSDGQGGLVTQRVCANPAPSSHQWTATKPSYDGKGFYWIKAGNGSCLTVPYNNGTPPGVGTQMFWWPCETRWSSGSQLWNVIPVDQLGGVRAYYFVNQWTGKCLTLDPATTGAKAGKVTQAACPTR
ncbi:RICIN domain-containing protein [Streptomyces sp. NPDC051051]|uniref:RICIN domain-containing protein n=1 Tax=Streptomyces sp. NPDC051051 TaxID=3155666 RepID=UPI0034141E9F